MIRANMALPAEQRSLNFACIKQGGFGLTCHKLAASAAILVATRGIAAMSYSNDEF